MDFLIRDGRCVAGLIQVCAALDTPETVSREYRALHKASAATRCRDLVILTRDGTPPPAALVPKGVGGRRTAGVGVAACRAVSLRANWLPAFRWSR